ncbi:hypothetical protein J5N97_007332 [Dioscorea zingiberensis]|uniref:Uncharacterized protein n=1 Tax=Dioscorea zingiberensis TaxID=325984 RepID=A0A9D5DBT2_9LILI|nr:hypothetical protein J5N97_007332 [Dioscorea zingiberensis]
MDLSLLKLDVDELLNEFTEGNFTTLTDFKRVWAARKFSYIYEARPTTNSAFFMQSLFSYCISNIVSQASLSRQLGGLYCLYCLHQTQPYKPSFKIYLSLEELKRLRTLVIDAKEKGIKVVMALVKRMLHMNMFLFGSVDMAGSFALQKVDEITKLQNKRVQIACEKLLANTQIEDFLHMDLGAEMELEKLKKISAEYANAKEQAIQEASQKVEVQDIKHIAENKKLVGDMIEEIADEWDSQKDMFYKQTGITQCNEVAVVDGFDELEHLLNE